uniref:Uncharacterized protein n=1 Tax=Chenopodium quinoa TaxID=63459 RepID=A0A803N943_CHEQI
MDQTKIVLHLLSGTFLFLCLSDLLLQAVTAEDQVTYLGSYCGGDQQYDQESEYANNVDLLLSNLTSRASTNKFYNVSSGETPNQVYGLFLCSSYTTDQVCQDCITLAQGEIRQQCPSSVASIVWYIECMLRYANHSIFAINDESVHRYMESGQAKYSQYNQDLTDTFISLFSTATTGNSSLASSTTVYLTKDLTMTCFVECTPDLSPSYCSNCLNSALSKLTTPGTQSGGLLQPSCRLMYAFNDAGSLSPGKGIYIALAVTSVVAASSLFLHFFAFLKRNKSTRKPIGIEEIESMENLHFELDTIKAATDDFSPANKLGQGGFGIVYMGKLADQQAVAINRLSNASGQGIKEFKTEACLAAKIQHKNLVKLFGFCLERDEMLLVYEFILSGQRNNLFDPDMEADSLLDYAWRLWDEGNSLKLLESALGNVSAKAEAERCIQVGLLCIQEEPDKRPSIASVLLMLNTQPITIPSPVRPPAFPYRLGKKAAPRESYSIQAECEITELNPR